MSESLNSMASPTSKPEKKLVEFLKEQQEPFILELYLLEKSKSWSSIKNFETPPSNSVINKKKKPLFPFFKLLLTAIHHDTKKKDFNTTNKHANVVDITREANQTVVETDRFSTASSSTMFHSCSDIDDEEKEEEDRTSFSSHKYHATCQACSFCMGRVQSQQDTTIGKHRQRCIEVCVTHETLNKDVCGVVVPKKITEDSLLSAALFSSLFQTSKRDKKNYNKQLQEILGHKRVLHKTKKLLLDCVRELTINLNRKDCKGSPEKLGKIIWERTKEWSQRGSGNYETNLTNLLNLDYLDSINEWSEYKTEVKDVSFEIADAILECVMKDEIVSEMFETLPPTTQQT